MCVCVKVQSQSKRKHVSLCICVYLNQSFKLNSKLFYLIFLIFMFIYRDFVFSKSNYLIFYIFLNKSLV